MAQSDYAFRAQAGSIWNDARRHKTERKASLKNIGKLLGSLGDRDVRPDQRWRWWPLEAGARIEHKHRTRARDLRMRRNHANPPRSSDNALLIDASRVICKMTTA
jgi:hypothetical protein